MNRNDRLVLIAAAVVGVLVLTGIYFLGRGNEEGERTMDDGRWKK